MGNDQARAAEIRQARVANPQYPYSDYKNHLRSDIHTLAETYNFSGRGICRNIPLLTKALKLDYVNKHDHMAEFPLIDTDELWYPKAFPGDEIIFVVYCEVVKEPKSKQAKKNKQPKANKAKCNFHLLQYEVVNRGIFHIDIDAHGVPEDYRISYDRYIQFCGANALKHQRCRNTMWASPVFENFFKKKKVHWIFQRVRGSGPVLTKHIEPISSVGIREGLSLNNFPSDFVCPVWSRIVVTGSIVSQGGAWSNHTIYVIKVELEQPGHQNQQHAFVHPPPVAQPIPPPVVQPIPPPAQPVSPASAFFPPTNPFSSVHIPIPLPSNPFAKIQQPELVPDSKPDVSILPAGAIAENPAPAPVQMEKEGDDMFKETV